MVMDFEPRHSPWPSPDSSSPAEGLSVENASAFFDFEAWNGITGNTTAVADIPDTVDTLNGNLAPTTVQQPCLDQATGERSWEQTPWIEPGLSPFADNLLQDILFDHVHPWNLHHDETTSPSAYPNLENGSRRATLDNTGGTCQCSRPNENKSTEGPSEADINMSAAQVARSGTQQEAPQTNYVPPKKKKRTRINDATKKILNTHFSFNPYPTETETTHLARNTKLTAQTIRTWFTNRRSRPAANDIMKSKESPDTLSFDDEGYSTLEMRDISRNSLDALEKVSPAASVSSLERYLASPASEDAVSIEAIQAIKATKRREFVVNPEEGMIRLSQQNFQRSPTEDPLQHYYMHHSSRSRSIAGSEDSRSSVNSLASQSSFRSIDSRGSRRGRKLWVRSQQQTTTNSQPTNQNIDTEADVGAETPFLRTKAATSLKTIDPLYCTWPSCGARFKFRWEWTRHEEAIHYQPHYWVCCPYEAADDPVTQCFICGVRDVTTSHIRREHFTSCMTKSQSQRTFLRKDQLIQHIKGTHKVKVSEINSIEGRKFVAFCQFPNNKAGDTATKCGFCGVVCADWYKRQDHVLQHIQSGACKASWWSRRLPSPTITELPNNGPGGGSFPCGNCGIELFDASTAFQTHRTCVAWSCRYLHDYHASFVTLSSDDGLLMSSCKLCNFFLQGESSDFEDHGKSLKAHSVLHHLESCQQGQHWSIVHFVMHLRVKHGATIDLANAKNLTLDSWRCTQTLLAPRPDRLERMTRQVFHKSALCSSEDSWLNVPCSGTPRTGERRDS